MSRKYPTFPDLDDFAFQGGCDVSSRECQHTTKRKKNGEEEEPNLGSFLFGYNFHALLPPLPVIVKQGQSQTEKSTTCRQQALNRFLILQIQSELEFRKQ
jgi:hypothetical protein